MTNMRITTLCALLLTACMETSTFQIGDCIELPERVETPREHWEKPWQPYQVLEVGHHSYRVKFVGYSLDDITLEFRDAAYYVRVPCKGHAAS